MSRAKQCAIDLSNALERQRAARDTDLNMLHLVVEEGTESVKRTTQASIDQIRQSAESMKLSVGNVHNRHRRKTARMGDADVPNHNRALKICAHNHLQAIQSAGDTAGGNN